MAGGAVWNRSLAPWFAVAGGLTAFVVVAVVLWRFLFVDIAAREEFRLSEQNLVVTPQPAWIHPNTNVKRDVIRDATLSQISLWDDQAVVKVARAFELHPWVRRVVRVHKRPPGQIVVDLEYRRPVALVEVLFQNTISYEPVDRDGVVLPEDAFHANAQLLDEYLRITVDYTLPNGPVGTRWDDERVVGAARIAAVLQETWKAWNLHRIVAVSGDPTDRHPVYELRTRGNGRILWGHSVDEERQGEPRAQTKITWISEYIHQHGSLDGSQGQPVTLDVRSDTGLRVVP
jgi:hypothetical protein